MGSVNKAILVGYVGKDPEVKSLQSGKQVAHLSLATSESWTDKASGEKRQKTEWHRVVCFNEHLVGVLERWVHKGSLIVVEGVIRTRKWTGQDGVDRFVTEIHIEAFRGGVTLLSGASEQDGGQARDGGGRAHRAETGGVGVGTGGGSSGWDGGAADFDDEIPF